MRRERLFASCDSYKARVAKLATGRVRVFEMLTSGGAQGSAKLSWSRRILSLTATRNFTGLLRKRRSTRLKNTLAAKNPITILKAVMASAIHTFGGREITLQVWSNTQRTG